MTDHPMSCYPGHFDKWRQGIWVATGFLLASDFVAGYDDAKRFGVTVFDVANATDRAMTRMMSGQITTGGRDE